MALLGWWKFDETSGTSFADSSGNGRTLTSSGTVTAGSSAIASAGVQSADLAGGYLYHAGDAALRAATTWTLGVWINFDTLVNNAHVLGMEYSGGRLNFGLIHNRDNSWGNGKFGIGFYDGSWRECYYNTALSASTTYFLCGTYDGTTMRFYIDGSEVVTSTPGGSNAASTGQLFLGRLWDSDSNHQDGRIDDAFVCSDVLTATDIANIYSDSAYLVTLYPTYDVTVMADSPLVYLKLDETSGTTANDVSGNGRNATIPSSNVNYSQAPMKSGLNNGIQLTSGVSQSINITYPSGGFLNNSSFSLEMWVNPSNWSNGNPLGIWDLTVGGNQECILVRKGDSGAGDNYQVGVSASGFASATSLYDPGSPTNGTVKHLVVTYDSGTGDMTLYVDAVNRGTASKATGGFAFSGSGTLAALANGGPNSRITQGIVSNVAVYGTALSSGRVSAHYAAGAPTTPVTYIKPAPRARFLAAQQRSRRF